MKKDPIVEETRAARRKLMRAAGGDMTELVRMLRAREAHARRTAVRPNARKAKKTSGRRAS